MIGPINCHSCFFLLVAAVACGFALAVVLSSNIVRMACCLVVSLSAVAGLFFLAGAEFIGAAQLMVYVGGTMVLLVFGVMLTTRGPFVSIKTGGGQWVLALVVGLALFAVLLQAAMSASAWSGMEIAQSDSEAKTDEAAADAPAVAEPCGDATGQLGLGLLGVRTDKIEQDDAVLREGMSGYLLAFEIISVHLVVVLVGAALLARARRRIRSPEPRTPSP